MQFLKAIGRAEDAPPWSAFYALLSTIAAFAAIVIGTTLTSLLFGQTPLQSVLGYVVGLLLVALFITVTRNRRPEDGAALKLGAARLPFVIIFLLALGMGILLDTLSIIATGVYLPPPELFGFFNLSTDPISVAPITLVGWALAIFLMVLVQPVAEELVFRGVAFPALRAALGPWPGFGMTAVFHAVFHLVAYAPPGGGSDFSLVWYTLLLPFLDALFLGWVRAYTGSTRAAMVAHAGLGAFLVMRAFIFAG